MSPILKNSLAVITGIVVGSVVNMGIITISESIIPPPEGADLKTLEGMKASIHLLGPKHFIFPFLAHAGGTFVGAWLAALIAATYKMRFAMAIGFVFLIGGIMASIMIPAPTWFKVFDIVFAYIPIAWLAGRFVSAKSN
ncbi:MAG: hypothetical protein EYC69_12515 [Bacteroidetes bacterium]|nr:MAG: hypothetical protein EYC69_12515 [Bacteroidota bacterium]